MSKPEVQAMMNHIETDMARFEEEYIMLKVDRPSYKVRSEEFWERFNRIKEDMCKLRRKLPELPEEGNFALLESLCKLKESMDNMLS
jgi:hypothetical protein